MTYENFKNANRNFWLSWTRPLLFITSEISRQSAWCTFSVHFKIFKMLFHSFFGIQNEKKKEKKNSPEDYYTIEESSDEFIPHYTLSQKGEYLPAAE